MRPIGKDDVEFYEGYIVMTVARTFVPPDKTWDTLSHRSRQRYLDRAVKAAQAILNDEQCCTRIARRLS